MSADLYAKHWYTLIKDPVCITKHIFQQNFKSLKLFCS